MLAPYKFPDLTPLADVKPRKFTPDLDGLIAWLETQDGATEYDYENHNDCLLCRFAKAFDETVFPENPWLSIIRIPTEARSRLSKAAYGPIWGWKFDGNEDCTYSAALSRALSLRSNRSGVEG